MAGTKLKAKRGATFRKGWVIYEGEDVIHPIAGITRGYPTIIIVTAHGMPSTDIPIALLDVGQLNTLNDEGDPSFVPKDRILAHKIDANTLSVNIDSTDFAENPSGYIVFRPPKNLSGYEARMQFRANADSETAFLELTHLAGLELGGAEGTIDMVLTDAQTTAFPEPAAEWNVELIAPGAEPRDVDRFDEGTIELSPDVNRPIIVP